MGCPDPAALEAPHTASLLFLKTELDSDTKAWSCLTLFAHRILVPSRGHGLSSGSQDVVCLPAKY